MKNLLFVLCVFFLSCTAKKGVFYEELSNVLIVKYEKAMLVIQTGNLKNHAAYLVYDIHVKADYSTKQLLLTGFQKQKKENKDRFEIDLNKLGIKNIQDYKIIWVDPDGKNTNLQLQKNETEK